MLEITQEQMDTMGERQVKRMNNEFIIHLQTYFPDRIQKFSDDQLNYFVSNSIKEALSYDIYTDNDLKVFLNIKVWLKVFGSYQDKPHTWVLDILNNERIGSGEERLAHLAAIVDNLMLRKEGG